MDSKLLKYVRSSYLFCLGDLYFQTVYVLRGRVTTDIIVIYSLILVEPRMGGCEIEISFEIHIAQ